MAQHLEEGWFLSLEELHSGMHAWCRVAQHIVDTVHIPLLKIVDTFHLYRTYNLILEAEYNIYT